MSEFTDWVITELNQRGWSYSELGRRAEISKGIISPVLGNKRKPGMKFCLGVARAFGMPPEEVLQRAGLSYLKRNESPVTDELAKCASYLPKEDQDILLRLARMMLKERGIESVPPEEEA